MARFCPVAPAHVLLELQNRGVCGNSHLTLAHDIVKPENQETYQKVFRRIRSLGINPLIILDNSVIETNEPVSIGTVLQARAIIQPTHVVLPDILENAEATARNCREALSLWDQSLGTQIDCKPCSLVYVPQGKSLMEFIKCAEVLADDPRITMWGCPRNLVKNIKTRYEAIQMLHILNPRRQLHMMGFSDDMVDDAICARLPMVTSIDSAVPLRVTQKFSLSLVPEPRGNWWEKAIVTPRMIENLERANFYFGW